MCVSLLIPVSEMRFRCNSNRRPVAISMLSWASGCSNDMHWCLHDLVPDLVRDSRSRQGAPVACIWQEGSLNAHIQQPFINAVDAGSPNVAWHSIITTYSVNFFMAIWLGLWTLTFWEIMDFPLDPQTNESFCRGLNSNQVWQLACWDRSP